jgi:hypothetical protein
VLAPVNSSLVNGQNYYTAITRARFGVKLWTEDPERLVERLVRYSGEKTSALKGLGRIDRNNRNQLANHHADMIGKLRAAQSRDRVERREKMLLGQLDEHVRNRGLPSRMTTGAQSIAEHFDRFLSRLLDQAPSGRRSARDLGDQAVSERKPGIER